MIHVDDKSKTTFWWVETMYPREREEDHKFPPFKKNCPIHGRRVTHNPLPSNHSGSGQSMAGTWHMIWVIGTIH